MRVLTSAGVVGFIMILMVSCGPKPGQDVAVVIQEQAQRAAQGQVDKALATLGRYYGSESYSANRGAFLQALIQIELGAGRVEAAQGRFENAARQSPVMAAPVLGLIENHLMTAGRNDELMRWCSRLLSLGLNDEALSRLAALQLRVLAQGGHAAEIPAQLAQYFSRMTPAGSLTLVQTTVTSLIQQKNWETADQVLSRAEGTIPDSPGREMTLMNGRVDLILARDGYKGALNYMASAMKAASDEAAARNIRVVGQASLAAGDLAAADAFYQSAMSAASGRIRSHEAAAEGWVKVAARRAVVSEVLSRMEHIQKQAGLSHSFLINLVSEHYAMLLGRGKPDTFKRLFTLCEQMDDGSLQAGDKAQLGGMMLDISYYLGDFELSLRLVEKGTVDIQGDMKLQMIAKIHAHIEMQKGNPREAVKYLREFMGYIAKSDRMEIDPVNNCRVTREMILGLNAKRIGDLLTTAGDAAESRKAYDEARAYYSKGLEAFPDTKSREHSKIVKERDEIPKG